MKYRKERPFRVKHNCFAAELAAATPARQGVTVAGVLWRRSRGVFCHRRRRGIWSMAPSHSLVDADQYLVSRKNAKGGDNVTTSRMFW